MGDLFLKYSIIFLLLYIDLVYNSKNSLIAFCFLTPSCHNYLAVTILTYYWKGFIYGGGLYITRPVLGYTSTCIWQICIYYFKVHIIIINVFQKYDGGLWRPACIKKAHYERTHQSFVVHSINPYQCPWPQIGKH